MTTSDSLFDFGRQQRANTTAPLAERMRPRTFEDFVGQEHILGPDRVLRPRTAEALEQALAEIEAGVTELVVNPGIETPELRAAHPGWNDWVGQHELLVDTVSIPKLLQRTGVIRIGYRTLRDAQVATGA